MRIGIMFSGGKDSTNTLWYYHEQGWEVCTLLSIITENPDSYMFQQTQQHLLEVQADALQIPVLFRSTKGEKEEELEDLKALLAEAKSSYGIDGVAVGALASDYQHERVTRVCHELNLKTFSPLWHKSQDQLLREMIVAGFDIRMSRIAADGLDESWLGRRLTEVDVDRLIALNKKMGLAVGGEGGEFETIVFGGPIFKNPVETPYTIVMESAHRGEIVFEGF